jgi:hypothetical protein
LEETNWGQNRRNNRETEFWKTKIGNTRMAQIPNQNGTPDKLKACNAGKGR